MEICLVDGDDEFLSYISETVPEVGDKISRRDSNLTYTVIGREIVLERYSDRFNGGSIRFIPESVRLTVVVENEQK